MFSKIKENSEKNICAGSPFLIKLHAEDLQLIKIETLAQVFYCEFCEIFKNTLLTEQI